MAGPLPNYFARVGVSYVTHGLFQPYITQLQGCTGITINTSSQPNANPHFGTVTTLMCVAAAAAEARAVTGLPVTIVFDQLENAPDRSHNRIKRHLVDGHEREFYMSLGDSRLPDGRRLVDVNMETFQWLFAFLEEHTGVPFTIRTYAECQADPVFRQSLITILSRPERFGPILAPIDESMHLRFPCPECRWIDKAAASVRLLGGGESTGLRFEAVCPDHGPHEVLLAPYSSDYVDTNTPMRDIAKVPAMIQTARRMDHFPLMMDGQDWAGRWDRCIHLPGVQLLGYGPLELPGRIYTPTVTDPYGAKLSKSLYVGSQAYRGLPPGFADLQTFLQVYGRNGLESLWGEIRTWATDPAYFERSYSVAYFAGRLNGELGPATVVG